MITRQRRAGLTGRGVWIYLFLALVGPFRLFPVLLMSGGCRYVFPCL